MSQHFLLDGYNIIKQTPSLNQGTLEHQRQALLDWINVARPQGSQRNQVTVVFDGNEEFFGKHSSSPVKVIFAKGRGQSADDVIKKIVELYPLKKSLVIVSNDKDIKFYVRALGASVLSVKEFAKDSFKKKQSLIDNKQGFSEKNVSLVQQAKINKELENIWIKKKV